MTLQLSPGPLKSNLLEILSYPTLVLMLYQNSSINVRAKALTKGERTYARTYLRRGQTLYSIAGALYEGTTRALT